MKNGLKILALSVALSATTVMADESLVSIEGAFGSIDVDKENTISGQATNDNASLAGAGLKIGAQSNDYRLFLTANYYDSSDDTYNYVATYGVELDYLIHPSNSFDIFLGLNGGIANIELIDEQNLKRTSSDPYIGGAAGINMHMSQTIDIELGARMLFMDISNTRNNVKYTYNSIVAGYASVIFKFQID